jgi:hypothetical protein
MQAAVIHKESAKPPALDKRGWFCSRLIDKTLLTGVQWPTPKSFCWASGTIWFCIHGVTRRAQHWASLHVAKGGSNLFMRFPSFIVIGAAKSGTTSLAKYLSQHPQVFLPKQKELFFFSHEPDDSFGIGLDLTSYSALYENAPPDVVLGEVSSAYLHFESSASKIKRYIPDVKLIAILRNPSERAYSEYLNRVRDLDYRVFDAKQRMMSFDEYVCEQPNLIRWGQYAQALAAYYTLFQANQIRVYLFEDLSQDGLSVMKDIFGFIGVDPNFNPDTSVKFNAGGVPKSLLLQSVLHKKHRLLASVSDLIKPFIPQRLRRTIRAHLQEQNLQRHVLPDESRAHLNEMFEEDIKALEQLIGRDLSAWLD